jgi:hypothetical protein
MPIHKGVNSKRIAAALAIFLGVAGPLRTARGGEGDAPASGTSAATAQPAGNAPQPAKAAAAAPTPAPDAVLQELDQLKDAVQAQSEKVAEHTQELDSERAALNQELQGIARLEAKLGIAPEAVASAVAAQPIGPTPVSSTDAQTAQQKGNQPNLVALENPVSFKIGNADITPGGFVDLTSIFRTTDVGSGLGTSFQSIPYNNTLPQGQLSEFRFTSQSSRFSLKVDAHISPETSVTGYIESDFNGAVPANANQSTNGDSMRLRLAWAQVRRGKWEFLGGQSWSLLTSTRVGLSPLPANIFTTLRVDSNYVAGMVYARQTGFRVVYHPANWWALGVSLENPDQFVPTSVFLPGGAAGIFANQFDSGSSSTYPASTATNTAIPNLHPDIIAKSAFDWKLGDHALHLEVGGIFRSFKDFQNLGAPTSTNTIAGGGGSVNTSFELFRNFHLIENAFYGDGVARYIGALGPDVVVRPNGTLSGVHAASGIGGFEWQSKPNLLVDAYYSNAYFGRNFALTTKALGTPCGANYCVGYGFPGSANTNNRDIQEFTFGLIPTIWSSPNYGKMQFITNFSYVLREPWFVAAGSPKNAHLFMTYLTLRYIIP